MPLDDDDVREILRLIDESDVEELRVETEGLSLYVRRGDGSAEPSGSAADAGGGRRRPTGCSRSSAPMLGIFYRAPGARARRRSSTSARASRTPRSWA